MSGSANPVGQALQDLIQRQGISQKAVGRAVGYDHSTISGIIRGQRRITDHVAPQVAGALDDPRLHMALSEQASGGAASPWLDGPAADLSRVATWAKGLEELEEAIEAGRRTMRVVTRSPAHASPEDRKLIGKALHELVEAVTAGRIAIAIACREYGLSHRELWQEHRAELKRKGYVA